MIGKYQMGIELQSMLSLNQSNSHNQQELLTRYFLLILENQRLHDQLAQSNSRDQQTDNVVLQRISQIQREMASELRHKQIRIDELNQYIKHIHQQKQQLMVKVDELQSKNKTLQIRHNKQKEEWHLNQVTSLSMNKVRQQADQHSQYHTRLLEREKQQLNQQIERLQKITIKQLQADIQILKKENQSYINSITTYRTEQSNFKIEKAKYEQKIKKYCEHINSLSSGKISDQKQISTLRHQISSIKLNYQSKESKYQTQIKRLIQDNQQNALKLNQAIKIVELELKNQKQESNRLTNEVQKKSKKLKEYDDQYTQYLNKLNALSLQNGQLKQQMNKQKQKHDKLLNEQRQKAKHFNKQATQKAETQFRNQKEKYLKEANERMKQIEIKSRKQKIQEVTALQKQIELLKNKLQTTLKEQQDRCVKIEQQKDSAIKQWEEIVVEMNTQKGIIASFQKQLQQYRKNSKMAIQSMKLIQHTPKQSSCQTITSHENIIIQNKQMQISSQKPADNHQIIQNKQFNLEQQCKIQEAKIQFQSLELSFKPVQRARVDSETLKKELQNLREVRKSVTSFQTISSQKNLNCCLECKEKSVYSRSKDKKSSYHQLDQKFHQRQNKQKYNTYRPSDKNSFIKPQMFYNQAQINQNNYLVSYQSEYIERPSLSNKRRDQGFKKYQYLRTKTEQNVFNSNLEISQGKSKHFFRSDQANLYRSIKEPERIVKSVKKQFSLQKNRQNDDDRRLSKCSSVRTVAYDRHLDQIQQYLSFDIGAKSLPRSGSECKLNERDRICSQRMKTYNVETDETSEKAVLMEKIGRINSWRDQVAVTKQTKSYNYSKRTAGQSAKSVRILDKDHLGKENINQIIHRKCQYISER